MPDFLRTIPVLRSFDEAKAKEFYLDFLGFTVDFEHRFEPDMPLYMGVSRGDLRLHISEHFGDAMPGSCVFIEMTGLREFHAELIGKRFKFARPGINPGHSGPGAISLNLTDPFGNKLRFEERAP
ncbi:MAG: glyoxalase superfamily protein [Bauldia sp.]